MYVIRNKRYGFPLVYLDRRGDCFTADNRQAKTFKTLAAAMVALERYPNTHDAVYSVAHGGCNF